MVQLYSLMWILGVFFTVIGLMRGWNREVVSTALIMLAMFVLFQIDSIIRGRFLLMLPIEHIFLVQVLIFLIAVFLAYQRRTFYIEDRRLGMQTSLLGGVVGFFNGYLVGGTLWYFMDINEYPFSPYIIAPAPNSPSAEFLGWMPQVIMSGGMTGSGNLLILFVVALFVLVLLVL